MRKYKKRGLSRVHVKTKSKPLPKRECQWCGRTYTPKGNNQKFCCKKHAKYNDNLLNLKRVNRFHRKHGYQSIGNSNLTGTPKTNFEIEYKLISNELERLNIRSKSLNKG